MTRGGYTVHGLALESELALPELSAFPLGRTADVTVSVASLSEGPWADPIGAEGYIVHGDSLFLNIPGVARYEIRGGSEIFVDPYPGAPVEGVRLFLLGSGLGGLLHQLGRLPVHASTLRIDGLGVAFSADSGGGKSTLAALLHRHGYAVTGDDVCALEATEGGSVLAHPGVPRLRLPPDSLRALGKEPGRPLPQSGTDQKTSIPIREARPTEPASLRRIYFLEWAEVREDAVLIEPMGSYEALLELRRNVYRHSLIAERGREHHFFDRAERALSTVGFFRLNRPRDLDRLDEILEPLSAHLADLRGLPKSD